MPRPLELLSPAADAETGIAAFAHGADAVYIGGPAFGARHAAGNPIADIERLARYGHAFGARTYLALNTLVTDAELPQALGIAAQAREAGVDALIVQDLGLIALLARELPDIAVHASTQCDIRTAAKARFLASLGCTRLVLARELSIGEVAEIARAVPGTAIECFVHGALCVSMSGLCLMSAAMGQGSANRGACSQPCRLPWTVTDAQGRVLARNHALCLKDNRQDGNLAALARAGATSFKIEGRLKDAGYIKNVTAHYRRALDAVIAADPQAFARASAGVSRPGFSPDPARSFNRGFTDYFARGRQPDIASPETPKSAGEPVGRVESVRGRDVTLRTEAGARLANGDGLTWTDAGGALQGFRANRAQRLAPGRWLLALARPAAGLAPGTVLRRNRDTDWDRALGRSSGDRTVAISRMELRAEGDTLSLSLLDETGISGSARIPAATQSASDADAARARLAKSLAKTGGTIFRADSAEILLPDPVPMLPAATANALRREALAALGRERLLAHRREPARAPSPIGYPESDPGLSANVLNRETARLLRAHGVVSIVPAFEAKDPGGEVTVMRCKHCIRKSLGICWRDTGIEPKPLTLAHGRHAFLARFYCKPCEMRLVRLSPRA